jgi:hypothetical protein
MYPEYMKYLFATFLFLAACGTSSTSFNREKSLVEEPNLLSFEVVQLEIRRAGVDARVRLKNLGQTPLMVNYKDVHVIQGGKKGSIETIHSGTVGIMPVASLPEPFVYLKPEGMVEETWVFSLPTASDDGAVRISLRRVFEATASRVPASGEPILKNVLWVPRE